MLTIIDHIDLHLARNKLSTMRETRDEKYNECLRKRGSKRIPTGWSLDIHIDIQNRSSMGEQDRFSPAITRSGVIIADRNGWTSFRESAGETGDENTNFMRVSLSSKSENTFVLEESLHVTLQALQRDFSQYFSLAKISVFK